MKKNVIENDNDLASVLKARRKELGVTQKTLASFCNLSHNGISRIEVADSDVKLSTLLKMSKILGFKIVIELEQ
jgi:predicted transcriptional regulator